VDSIPTSANQEDHVSMAPNAGHQLKQIVSNTSKIIAIELMCDAQARDLNPQYHLAPCSEAIYQLIRNEVPYQEVDGPLSAHIEAIHGMVSSGAIANIVEHHLEAQA
jgi:histidine ammonia-lyase